MWVEMDSTTNRTKIYVRLLDEGTEVSRPTVARELGAGLYEILPTEQYDPEDEKWEFPPGSVVKAKRIDDDTGTYLLATAL
jgi:hypothetical protein